MFYLVRASVGIEAKDVYFEDALENIRRRGLNNLGLCNMLIDCLLYTSLSIIENIILQCIRLGVLEGTHYKEIYQQCKKRLEHYQEVAFLTAG